MPRRRRAAEHGAVAVEFATTATVLLLLTLGILAYGVQFGARLLAAQAAAEGARAAAAGLTEAERATLARDAAGRLLDSYGGFGRARQVSVTQAGSPASRLDVEVRLDLGAFGLTRLSAVLPGMRGTVSARVGVQVGGF